MNRAAVDDTLAYHSHIARSMTAQRTALESALIPVSAYILIACIECYRRYPDMMRAITAASPPEVLGAAGRQPGCQIDAVHLWSIANFPLLGRQVLAPFGMIDPADDLDRLATVFDFWRPAAEAFRADGNLQSWDAGLVTPRYDADVLATLVEGATEIGSDDERASLARTNALLTSFIFLLYFDTRAGYQDTGPYELADGRTLLVRDFNEIGVSHFPWSREVCAEIPYRNLTVAMVLDGVRVQCNDWGTSVTHPPDYFERVVEYAAFDPAGGVLTPVPRSALADLTAAVKQAQRILYRLIAGMTRGEKLDAGAYVYFTFLRPFARVAGVEDALDWTVPRDSLDVYDALAQIDRIPEIQADDSIPYYTPLPPS